MAAAKNVIMWHRAVEKGPGALENAWRRVDVRQSNARRQREALWIKGRQQSIRQQRHRDDYGMEDDTGWNRRKELLALLLIRGWGKSMYSSYVCAFVL